MALLSDLGLDVLQVIPTRSGVFSAVAGEKFLLSAYDPLREADRQAAALPQVATRVVGLGLGYLSRALGPRLAGVFAFSGELDRWRHFKIYSEDAEFFNHVQEFETLRDLELAMLAAVQRGEHIVLDPTLGASPSLHARLGDLVTQLLGRPRVVFIHLKTAGDVIRTFAAIQSWRRAHMASDITFITECPYGDLAALAEGIDRVIELTPGASVLPRDFPRPLFAVNFGNEDRPAQLLRALDPLLVAGFAADADGHSALVDERNDQHANELANVRNHMNRYHFAFALLGLPASWDVPLLRTPINPCATRTPYGVAQFGAGSGEAVWAPKRVDPKSMGAALRAAGGRWLAVGGADERDLALEAGIVEGDNLCGQTSWTELVGILSGAEHYVGHDSGPTHIAAALGIPTLALFGFTSPILNAPIGPRTLVVQADMPCAFRGCAVACPEVACTQAMTADAIHAAILHLQAQGLVSRLSTAATLRDFGLRAFYPGYGVENEDPLRSLLNTEPRLEAPLEPALALAREWLESTGR